MEDPAHAGRIVVVNLDQPLHVIPELPRHYLHRTRRPCAPPSAVLHSCGILRFRLHSSTLGGSTRIAEKCGGRNAEEPGNLAQGARARHAFPDLPRAHQAGGNAELLGQFPLGQSTGFAERTEAFRKKFGFYTFFHLICGEVAGNSIAIGDD